MNKGDWGQSSSGGRKFLLASLLGLLLSGSGCQVTAPRDQVCYQGHCFEVRIAADESSRLRGLQGQTQLGEKEGMLFIFSESQPYPFWMKDTLIPLDIVWLDFTQRIVHMEKNVPPCKADPCPNYVPVKDALYVLELNAGTTDRMGIKNRDRLSFQLDKYLAETVK